MKLSCLPVSLYDALSAGEWTLADWFAFAHDLGLDGADISVAHLTSRKPQDLHAIRAAAQAAGVQIAMLVAYCDFTHPDPAERSRQQTQLRADIDAAAELDASFLRVTAGQDHPGLDRDAATGWAVEGLTSQLDYARAAGVTLVYENHSIGYGWRYYDFSQPAAIFLEIAARTAAAGLFILFDTANAYAAGDDGGQIMHAVLERIAVVHLADIRRVGAYKPVVLGTGIVPIPTMLRQLRAAGFDGWASVEEASCSGADGFRRAIAYGRRAWSMAETRR